MAILRTDRNRRILGDRVVNRGTLFQAIHSAVAEVHSQFACHHRELQATLAARTKEETEADQAREGRVSGVLELFGHYSWAYNRLDPLLNSSWKTTATAESGGVVRKRLFPLGNPSTVAESPQLVLDGMVTFLNAATTAGFPAYPAEFITDAKASLKRVQDSNASVIKESDEATAATRLHLGKRLVWDAHYVALREISTGFLRIQGRLDLLTTLFQGLPENPGHPGEEQEDIPATPVIPVGIPT